ncbi:hypothetical protein ACFLTH_16835, partial [Bacteroidota bacterium]
MMKKIALGILVILLSQIVLGIGVGPAKTNILFEPNLTTQYTINIYNTDNKEFEVILGLRGELEQYILLESNKVEFQSDDKSKKVFFNISFPRDVPPGDYYGEILIIEKPLGSEDTITASLGVTHDVSLYVPTHGKYIKEFIEQTENSVDISVENIGLKTIEELKIISDIHDDNLSDKKQLYKNNFIANEFFEANIPINIPQGDYVHNISIMYDELSKE